MTQPAVLGSLSLDKVPVVVRPDYTISYERGPECIFVHVDVRRWTTGTARQFRADTEAAQGLLGEPVYALREPSAPLQPKFLALAGFIPCGTVIESSSGEPLTIHCRPFPGKRVLLFNP
ncbi:hypothetical protein C0V97_12500 [Asaia sp. W19]|nr:hypothetical protein C0V97_18065 [Asaia sp. W19]RUT25396.1 hypothetical protein C0V97_12500 [Asaia sp. W19]